MPVNILQEIGVFECLGPTRDNQSVLAYREPSGVIFLDTDVGHDYKSRSVPSTSKQMAIDNERRVLQFGGLLWGKKWLDFGCGNGEFATMLDGFGIDPCFHPYHPFFLSNMAFFDSVKFDVVTAFHVVEHLRDPVLALSDIRTYMGNNAQLIVEVPHANDWLLRNCEAFLRFSLWTEHLILHTQKSLRLLLEAAGFHVDTIVGFQRYGINNHKEWIANGVPGGETYDDDENRAYVKMLERSFETDTLIAYATNRVSDCIPVLTT